MSANKPEYRSHPVTLERFLVDLTEPGWIGRYLTGRQDAGSTLKADQSGTRALSPLQSVAPPISQLADPQDGTGRKKCSATGIIAGMAITLGAVRQPLTNK
jgi:hypothetical protein